MTSFLLHAAVTSPVREKQQSTSATSRAYGVPQKLKVGKARLWPNRIGSDINCVMGQFYLSVFRPQLPELGWEQRKRHSLEESQTQR